MFFYGTLKRGQSNHDRFCQEALRVEPPAATTLSHLYELPFGFPGLYVYGRDVRSAPQTISPTRRSNARRLPRRWPPRPRGISSTISSTASCSPSKTRRGDSELSTRSKATPGENSLYQRVPIPVHARGETLLA